MKIRKILCVAAALCVLCSVCSAAGADGAYSGYSIAPVNIWLDRVMPNSNWEVQQHNGAPIGWGIQYALDGNWSTSMGFMGWNTEALDDIPDISFYFNGASIRDLWIRNGWDSEYYTEYARIMILDMTVWCGDTAYVIPRFKLQDSIDTTLFNQNWIDGYQRLSLPMRYDNVTRVDLFIKGWYQGEGNKKYEMRIADMVFLPATPEELYGSNIFNGGGYYPYPVWTPTPQPWAPTLIPTATPRPTMGPTDNPNTGIQVLTKERLATRSGPGTDYTELGSYFQQGTWVRALSAAYDSKNGIWWIQVELTYLGEQRRVYTGVKRLEMNADMVRTEEPQEVAKLTRSVYPYWGPGYGYSMYNDQVPAGTSGTVWAYEGLYAQFEYYDGSRGQYRRVWVPANSLEEDEGNG